MLTVEYIKVAVAKFFRCCWPFGSQNDDPAPPGTVEQVFMEWSEGKDHMTTQNVKAFLEDCQGHTEVTTEEAQEYLRKAHDTGSHHLSDFFHIHHNKPEENPHELDLAGFTRLLMTPDINSALKPSERTHDMTSPLAYYYVNTSHNSYLTGNQLWSSSSTAPIIEALKKGCRVIELDTWEQKGVLNVLHGGTLTKPVKFRDCVQGIKDHAFVASEYPVIITIENHLTPKFQTEAAKLLKDVLGDLLYSPSAEERAPLQFLSPEALKRKIIISDKPYRDLVEEQVEEDPEAAIDAAQDVMFGERDNPLKNQKRFPGPTAVKEGAKVLDKVTDQEPMEPESPKAQEFEDLLYIPCEKPSEMKEKHEKDGPLVCGDSANMANLSEPQLKKFINNHRSSILEYTKSNLGRVYPFGLRFDSSNADPMVAWSHGCQLAALNLQGYDRPSWLGFGFFLANGGCGYVRKPDIFLPSSTLSYEDVLVLPEKLRLKVKVLLGSNWHKMFDIFKHPDFYVKVGVHGIETDNKEKRTRVAHSTSEPKWEDEEFQFTIRVPEIALLRFEVMEMDIDRDDFVGQFVLPITLLRTGIRVVPLRTKEGVEVSSKLLCQITLEDIDVSAENAEPADGTGEMAG